MTPTALRALALSLQVHGSVRAALMAWHQDVPASDMRDAGSIGALVRLGASPDDACTAVFGEAGVELGGILARGEDLGGRVGDAVAAYSRRLENERASTRSRNAAAAGAKLSTRIVAGLPALLLVAAMFRSRPDGLTLALGATGGLLCSAGVGWMAKLRPMLRDDATERLAGAIADGIDAGALPDEVLSRLAADPLYEELLAHPGNRVAAGALWPDALAATEERGIRSIGLACAQARRYGTPLAPVLRALASQAAESRATDLEFAVRRTPIRMVVPLTLFVLPGALLLVAAAFVP